MAGFAFDPNAIFNFDDVDANFEMYPDVFGEEEGTNANQGTTSHSGEGAVGDTGVGNLINYDNEPFVGLGALMTNDNFDPTRAISEDNDPFMAVEAPTVTTYDNSDPEHGQTQHQQAFEESVGLSQNAGLVPETNQVAANVSSVEEEDWFKLTNQEQDEAFHRLMEMSPEAFEEMMRGFPAEEITALTAPGPSSATPYADTKKRVRLDEEGSASTLVGGALSIPQLDFEPHQIQQVRQLREAKSRRGKAIEGLEKRVQDLVADLAKAQLEAKDAFENGRMVALLGVDGSWEAREAMLKNDAQILHEQQISAVRNFLERQIAEKDEQLAHYRAEAEEYKTSVEGEAGNYKQAAEEEMKAQEAALEKRSKEINILREEGQKYSKELEINRRQIKAQSGEIASLQIQCDNSESSNKEKDKKITSLQELLDSSSTQRSNSLHQEELKLLKEQLAQSESFLNKARSENTLLREHRELEDLQATSEMDIAAPTEADTELVQAMLEKEREKIEAENCGRENRVNETIKRLEETEQERRQMLKDELDRKEAELYDAQKRISDLEQQLLVSSSSESSQPPSQASPISAHALPLTPPTPTPPAAGPSPSPQRSRLPGPRSLLIVILISFLTIFAPFLHSLATSGLEYEPVGIATREDRLQWEAWELASRERDQGVPTHEESWRRTQEVGEMGDWNPLRG